jgi:hypothetical protein
MTRLQVTARHDPVVAGAFLQVAGFLAPPPSLLHPGIAFRVLRGNRHAPTHYPEPAVAVTQPAQS